MEPLLAADAGIITTDAEIFSADIFFFLYLKDTRCCIT